MTEPAFRAALPDLAYQVESALLHIGRGDIVDQLREASIERWEYDEFADTTSIFVTVAPEARPSPRPGTVSIYDEVGVILETDDDGRVTVIEVAGGRDLVQRLEERKQ